MRLFLEITRRAYRRYITYRAAIVAGLITNFFFGILRVAIMLALYGNQQEVAGMTQQQAITYTALTQGVIAYLSLFGWYDLMNSVHSGEVANDLLKPMGLEGTRPGTCLGAIFAAGRDDHGRVCHRV